MAEPTSTPIGIAILDEMIARAETACDRGRAELAARRKPYLRVRPNCFGGQQAMEDTLARLRAQRAAIENTRQIDKKRAGVHPV